MRLLHDERGQSVQVGAAILLGFIVIAITMYQVEVVADQNAEVEFNHQQDVRQDLIDLRNSISNAGSQGEGDAVSVQLGTQYPPRTIFVNPPSPRGVLRSESAGSVWLENAEVTDPSVYTEPDNAMSIVTTNHTTSRLIYTPGYAEFNSPGSVYLEHSLAYARYDNNASSALTAQDIVNGEDLSLTFLHGNLSEQGTTAQSVDPRTISRTTDPIAIDRNDTAEPIALNLPTRTPSVWNETLAAQPNASVTAYDPSTNTIRVALNRTQYQLQVAAVGVGTGIPETEAYDVRRDEDTGSGGGSGAYTLSWTNPDEESANDDVALSDCSSDSCIWNVGAGSSPTLTLNATLDPPFQDIDLDYRTTNSSVVRLNRPSGSTNSSGANTTSVTAKESGTVKVLTTSPDGSDVITLTVENVSGIGNRAPSPSIDNIADNSIECNDNNKNKCKGEPLAEFDVDWSATDPDGNMTAVTVELQDPGGTPVDSQTYSYSGTGSASGTTTLVHDPGQWNANYTIRVNASDGSLSRTVSQIERADGN